MSEGVDDLYGAVFDAVFGEETKPRGALGVSDELAGERASDRRRLVRSSTSMERGQPPRS
jgi:hypothetical protein